MMTGDEQVMMSLFEKRNVFLKKNSLEGDAKRLPKTVEKINDR